MNKRNNRLIALLAWLLASLVTTTLWIRFPELFPTIPEALWRWADSIYQSANAEEVAELDFMVIFFIAATTLLIVIGIGRCLVRHSSTSKQVNGQGEA